MRDVENEASFCWKQRIGTSSSTIVIKADWFTCCSIMESFELDFCSCWLHPLPATEIRLVYSGLRKAAAIWAISSTGSLRQSTLTIFGVKTAAISSLHLAAQWTLRWKSSRWKKGDSSSSLTFHEVSMKLDKHEEKGDPVRVSQASYAHSPSVIRAY